MALVVVAALTTGCARRTTIGAGTVTAGVGALYLVAAKSMECDSGEIGCGAFAQLSEGLGIGLLLTGMVILIAGLAMPKDKPPEIPDWRTIPPGAAPYRAHPPMTVTSPLPKPRLPPPPIIAIPSVALQHQLAIDASNAARQGHCSSALRAGGQLYQLDPDLHRTLAAIDTPYARCIASASRR